jgi:tetratricopeptide (TPR) repeat protein
MATHMPPGRSFADEAADVAAAASATSTANGAARAPQKVKSSRRKRLVLFSVIPVVAVAAGTLSMATGLVGGKKKPAQTPAQQASTLLNAGLAAQGKGNITTATSDYHQVLALDPKNEFAYYDLGLIDQRAGRNAQAETEYRQALTIDPNFEVALFNLAILRTGPAPQEAVDLYRHAITLNSKDAGAHLNLGFLLESIGQREEGVSELKLAIGLDPKLSSRVPAAAISASTPAPAPAKR